MPSFADRFYDALHEVARYYQFRDRDDLVCHGLTPSQCYALYALRCHGRITMRELSDRVGLDPSSMTRSIDGLFKQGFISRSQDPSDRRRCVIDLTRSGRTTIEAIRAACVGEAASILEQIDQSSRRDVVRALELVAECLDPPDPKSRRGV